MIPQAADQVRRDAINFRSFKNIGRLAHTDRLVLVSDPPHRASRQIRWSGAELPEMSVSRYGRGVYPHSHPGEDARCQSASREPTRQVIYGRPL